LPVYFVARLLGINKVPLFSSKMYEMIATGELPTIHIGRAVRVTSNAIGKWVEEHEQQEDVSA
jgi:excisionase family DNA binding protein